MLILLSMFQILDLWICCFLFSPVFVTLKLSVWGHFPSSWSTVLSVCHLWKSSFESLTNAFILPSSSMCSMDPQLWVTVLFLPERWWWYSILWKAYIVSVHCSEWFSWSSFFISVTFPFDSISNISGHFWQSSFGRLSYTLSS